MQFSFWVVSFLVLIFFLIIYLRYRAFKNSILFFTLAIICCFRIQYKPEVSVPPKCYKIQKIVKENHQKIIFIAEGKEKVLFTLKRFGNDSSGYYCNDVIEYRGRLKSLPVPKNLKDFVYADYLTKTGVDSELADSIIALLCEFGEIDANLWKIKKLIWWQNFVDSLKELYKKRKNELPTKNDFEL